MTKPADYGVKPKHTVWSSVCTSGYVDVEWGSRSSGVPTTLPPGYRMILKDIDSDDIATCYRDDVGVIRVPAWTLEPWHR